MSDYSEGVDWCVRYLRFFTNMKIGDRFITQFLPNLETNVIT
jgi:hypothetical protein